MEVVLSPQGVNYHQGISLSFKAPFTYDVGFNCPRIWAKLSLKAKLYVWKVWFLSAVTQ